MVRLIKSGKLFAAATAAIVLLSIPDALAAWNRTEIKWKSIETEHFSVHFHEGEEWSAREVARIAEEIYGPVTEFYDYELDRVYINLHDNDDRSAGAAYFYLNRIDLDASDYEFHLRGTADWLRNVLTHEFTHMVTIRSAMKMPRWLPSIYLQGITFEREKRPDVITGYPNFQGSLPIAGVTIPSWFAEGVAQFQCPTSRNDIWDSHRDMLLRIAVLEKGLLSLDEMGVFGKNSLESELVYNQGYSLVKFISQEFGRESLGELLEAHKAWYSRPASFWEYFKIWNRSGFEGACRKTLGISSSELYRRWKDSMETEYIHVREMIQERWIEGVRFAGEGYMNLFPVVSAAGGKVYYLSNMGRDYMGMDLVCLESDGSTRIISEDVNSRPGISKDGSKLCYAKRSDDNPHGYEINDIFIFDLNTEKEERLTRGLRVVDPEFSPDGGSIAAVRTGDGKEDIVLVDVAFYVDNRDVKLLVSGERGYRYHGLSWSDRGILTSRFNGTTRDIVLIDPVTRTDTVLVGKLADERDPSWDDSGSGYFYASDRTGIFNIYHRESCHGDDQMVTNLLGGAFSPVSHNEGLLFSSYGRDGYGIRKIEDWRGKAISGSAIPEEREVMENRSNYICRLRTADGTGALYDYYELDKKISEAHDYDIKYTPIYLFPRLMYYDKKPRIGLTLDTRDYLDRQNFYASGSINDDKEYNIQAGIETRQFKPTFAVNFYSARKYYKYYEEALGNVQVRYDLWDVFFSCMFEFDEPSARKRKDAVLRFNHGEYGLNINAWEAEDIDMELGWNYYKSNEVSLILNYWNIGSGVESDINPRKGRRISLELTRAWNNLSSGEFEYNFKPFYDVNNFGRYYLHYEEFIPVPFWSHSLALFVKGGFIDKKEVDDFFNLFLGSRDGMRGYSYYSMGGKKNAMARLTYRFPIWRNINWQMMSTYLGSVYGAVFVEAGKAWDEDKFDLDHNMKDAGFELRMKGFSFYNYPLAVSFEGAYGFNEIKYVDPFIEGLRTYEGKEWKFYGTIFFDF
ncbi:MAG: hypothetical protein KOO63_00170 [Bacteroidales bacterium]|nr:hypothetical protein [Candidatus Latescibacterota bacterium]